MGRPRQISDEQILSAMREAVTAKGSRVPLEAVADALKVSVPALLKRFGSREALMVAALRPPDPPEWVEALSRGPDQGPLEGQLTQLFTRLCNFMTQAMPCVIALRESGIPVDRWLQPRAKQREIEAVQCWLSLAKKKGLVLADELEASAMAMLGAVQSRAFLAHLLRKGFPEKEQRAYVRDLARIFTRALSSHADQGKHHGTKVKTGRTPAARPQSRSRAGRMRQGIPEGDG